MNPSSTYVMKLYAALPLRFETGFLRDANGSIVLTGKGL